MTKPTLEQFGLTTETVASLTEEQARQAKRRDTLCWSLCVGLSVIGAIFIGSRSTTDYIGLPFFNIILYIFVSLVAVLFNTCFLWVIIRPVFNFLFSDPLRYKTLTRYLKVTEEYEAWFIRTQEAFWERLTGRGFEIEVTNLLNRAGYCARLTPASGDGGVDIILGDGTIVQCKAHRAPASPGVVRELYGALIHQNAPKAMLISLNGVTTGVHSFLKDKPIIVWDKTNLIALQRAIDKS